MPISLEWDPARETWTLTSAERFTLAEIGEVIEKTDWNGARRFLWDLRELVEGPDSTSELRNAAAWVKRSQETWGGTRVAILVSRDVDFGIARMYQAFAEQIDVEYQIFRDRDEAQAWLERSG